MHECRIQTDGAKREGDNWQKGIPLTAYMKSAWRHFFDLWKLHRGYMVEGVTLKQAICALMFNLEGYLHESLKADSTTGISTERKEH